MKDRKYLIEFEGKELGFTRFEHADAPMGVVFGKIVFTSEIYDYEKFRSFCFARDIVPNIDEPESKHINVSMPSLKIYSPEGVAIEGQGVCISGFDPEGFEIEVIGIPYPFYEEEFPHHREHYENMHK